MSKTRKVHKADKEVTGLKPTSAPKKTDVVTQIRKVPRPDKEDKVPPKKTPSVPEKESDDYSDSSNRTISDKYVNKDNIDPKKTKAPSDYIVQQENLALSSDVVQQNVDRRRLSMALTN